MKAINTKQAKRKKRPPVMIVVTVLMLISLVSYKIYCDARYHEMTNELSSLKKQYELLKNEEIQLNVKLDSKADLSVIEQIASDDLGMNKIEQYQIKYVNLESEDKAEVIALDEDGLFDGLFRNFSIILEYLR